MHAFVVALDVWISSRLHSLTADVGFIQSYSSCAFPFFFTLNKINQFPYLSLLIDIIIYVCFTWGPRQQIANEQRHNACILCTLFSQNLYKYFPSFFPHTHLSLLKIPAQILISSMAPCLSTFSSPSSPVAIVSKCTIYPDQKSTLGELRLSVSDLPMLSCHYIQKGLFFPCPQIPIAHLLLPLLKSSLSRALSFFPALAGRLTTHSDGAIYIACNDSGAEFTHAVAPSLSLDVLLPSGGSAVDVPQAVKSLFVMDCTVSYQGHFRPLAAFQFTELGGDGAVFIGCTINHAIVDGTSF